MEGALPRLFQAIKALMIFLNHFYLLRLIRPDGMRSDAMTWLTVLPA